MGSNVVMKYYDDKEYLQAIIANYDSLTAGNACKMNTIAKGFDDYSYDDCDTVYMMA